MKIKKIVWIVFFALLISIGAIALYMMQHIRGLEENVVVKQDEMLLTVPAGTGRVAMEQLLIKNNLLNQGDYFQILLKVKPELSQFKAGTYRLTKGMTLRDVLLLIKSGKEAQFTIRFIEGSRLQDWQSIFEQAPQLTTVAHTMDSDKLREEIGIKPEFVNLEGWFAPDTYHYTAGTTDVAILKRAYQQMEKTLEEEWIKRDSDLPYKSAYEMLIMASIIEKETGIDAERTKVASVFVNRLKTNMRLQTDPTVIYGLGDKYRGTIYRSDLNGYTPYNTYQIDGLPPTPIAMPGVASIRAAAHPADTRYLYFVADGTGGHKFSTTLNEHNKAVAQYRRLQQR
ncbi:MULTISPECIES: endolytic transglycosylase MltG [Proteus]|uniref:endolytic transglycosylase MltG n=1 Tax=Proteus TaxID=583 RepID=UPI0013774F85|nr:MULTISPECIES: endolytic transglycosylase MltG [Proteus]NBM02054.1 endolytic transglycosylase MltG [Proteus sp. G2671]NBM50569.1 endolytic transglycosylase MltG [Proteus sp. G2666]NBM79980.1 endolytic transglycosylase MltG [Proteus sp. G2659]NBM90343.1 endolytic transglycosylase MltG [Proteus sp. G2658]